MRGETSDCYLPNTRPVFCSHLLDIFPFFGHRESRERAKRKRARIQTGGSGTSLGRSKRHAKTKSAEGR